MALNVLNKVSCSLSTKYQRPAEKIKTLSWTPLYMK